MDPLELASLPPEERKRIMSAMDDDTLRLFVQAKRVLNARNNFTAEGFKDFFWCLYGYEYYEHVNEWTRLAFEEINSDKKIRGLMVEGFRGSTKSTFDMTLAMFITGHFPWKNGLNVQKNDEEAVKVNKFMAEIVESNAGWRSVFPHVVPDAQRGWNTDGYQIKDTRVPYEDWVQKTMSDHGREPTFVAVSVTSGSVGKHPTGWLLFDDIHDYKNTSSKAEMLGVVSRVKADILPTLIRGGEHPFVLWAYTPWDEGDAYSVVKAADMFKHVFTPAWVPDEEGTVVWDGVKGRLTCPDVIDEDGMYLWKRALTNEFERMILLDLSKSGEKLFKYHGYPHEKIDPKWLKAGGVDYASVNMPNRQVQGGRSHFALAIVSKTPMNTVVVYDGFVGQITQAEAEEKCYETQKLWDMTGSWKTTVIESNGKGEEFIALMRRNPKFKVFPNGVGVRTKPQRLYDMSPWLENMQVTVSDAQTPFLNDFRKFLDTYPNIEKNSRLWDVADSVYHALFAFRECLSQPTVDTPSGQLEGTKKKNRDHPWRLPGDWSGLND